MARHHCAMAPRLLEREAPLGELIAALEAAEAGHGATALVMGEAGIIEGHVESIAAGIADRERGESPNLLANVNPTFSWVRLAQRVPVRVSIDRLPEGLRLVSGRHLPCRGCTSRRSRG